MLGMSWVGQSNWSAQVENFARYIEPQHLVIVLSSVKMLLVCKRISESLYMLFFSQSSLQIVRDLYLAHHFRGFCHGD